MINCKLLLTGIVCAAMFLGTVSSAGASWLSERAKEAGEVVEKAGEVIEEGVEKAGEVIEKVGEGIEKAGEGVEKIGESYWKMHPANYAGQMLGGKSLQEISDEAEKDLENLGRALSKSPTFMSPGLSAMRQAYVDAVQEVYGNEIASAFQGLANVPDTLAQISTSSFEALALAIREKDVKFLTIAPVAVPIASALRQTRKYFSDDARALPSEVKIALSKEFTEDQLNRARFVVNRDSTTLNGVTNWLQTKVFSKENHAVVADDIIVFAKYPSEQNYSFWAHEVKHTVQYSKLGIDTFSSYYVLGILTGKNVIEDEAKEVEVRFR